MKLRNKIHLSTSVLFIFLLIIMNIAIYFTFSTVTIKGELDEAKAEGEQVLIGMREGLKTLPLADLLRGYAPVDGMIRVVTEGKTTSPQVTSPSEKGLTKMEVEYFRESVAKKIEYKGKPYTFVSMPVILEDGQVANIQMTKSLQSTSETLNILRIVLIGVTIVAMIPVIISSRFLANFITTPILSMIDTMAEILKSGSFKRIEQNEKTNDELQVMGDTFNQMIDILEANFQKQEDFASDASHELKTPLTVIESYSSLLKRRGMDNPKLFEESVEAIHSEALRMREMTEQLLMLARPHEKWDIHVEKFSIKPFVNDVAKTFEKAFNRTIHTEFEKDVEIESDKQKLKQLLFIFLDNARKYSEEDIKLTVGEENGKSFIRISDRGIGIPREDLPKVFDRFFRVDKARSRKQGGTGLGLSLAKELSDVLQLDVHIDSVEGLGTSVTISFKNEEQF